MSDNTTTESKVQEEGKLEAAASPENISYEPEVLPFQSLAVELDEDAGSADVALQNDDTAASSVSTVLSCLDFSADAVDNEENVSTAELSPDKLLEQSMVSSDADIENEDSTSDISPDKLLEQSMVSSGDAEQTEDSTEPRVEMTCMPPEVEDDTAVDYDANVFMQTSEQNLNDNAKSYLEDFLLSVPGSSVGAQDSDSLSNDEKGSPLHRFPKIVKAMETADYATLQVLYRLLYLRNAWDTDKILTQRILDFSGFNCDPNSEDYYTRELMLRTVSCDVLLSIAKLLCIGNLVTITDFDKLKIDMVSRIMKFLYKPKRRPGRSRQIGTTRSSRSRGGRGGGRAAQRYKAPDPAVVSPNIYDNPNKGTTKAVASYSLAEAMRQPNKVSPLKASTSSPKDKVGKSDLGRIKVDDIKNKVAGAKVSEKPLSTEQLIEMETALKKNLAQGKALQPKVDLKRLDLKDFRLFSGKSSSSRPSKDQDDSSDTDDDVRVTMKQLRDFPSVVSSIEGTPDELLTEIHHLLFLDKGTSTFLKDRILNFSGFTFDAESDEYRKRIDCLKNLNENVVKDIARALFLDPKSDKEATIVLLLTFLKRPYEKYLRPTVIASGMLSDCDFDIENMSDFDSDDSITCEVVQKKVETIDLISEGEDSDGGHKKVVVKKERPDPMLAAVLKKDTTPVAKPVPEVTPESVTPAPASGRNRTLRDFETITKIVNTHPTEYLVDIYNLLYMTNYELPTLRKDILDFTGFEFEKGTSEYVRRKQFLDRMLYNSVRRIYNTLIHNTREVKVFSKPTMIGEIFQFLFKLPDHDTSIRPLPPKPNSVLPYSSNTVNKTAGAADLASKGVGSSIIPSQPGRLSDLKRVFQRVACFPCEYLVDVHKLLFMTDCDMKDIRANIFGFKGFSFDVESNDFNQRKLYLEYLTFHSLRKISSVLTTKTVDLRNSTKHELASHLTEVLKEYTSTFLETETVDPNPAPIEATPLMSADSAVEQIVVTPIIQPMRPSPVASPEQPYLDDNMTVSSSTPFMMQHIGPPPAAQGKKQQSKPKSSRSKGHGNAIQESANNNSLQFADVNLPEIENYRSMYQAGSMSQSDCPPVEPIITTAPNQTFAYRPEFMLQQVSAPYGSLMPQPVPYIQTFPQPIHIQAPYVLPQATVQPTMKTISDDEPIRNMLEISIDDSEHTVKRMRRNSGGSELHILDTHSLADRKDDSLHLKIRDAMTKASEDEEDCDKPLAALLGHPNDKVLKQQICEIVENTDLQEITMNGVIQKIFSMYPKFNLNYRKEYIKSTLRSLLYRLGENHNTITDSSNSANVYSGSPDCSVSTTDPRDSPELSADSLPLGKWKEGAAAATSFQSKRKRR